MSRARASAVAAVAGLLLIGFVAHLKSGVPQPALPLIAETPAATAPAAGPSNPEATHEAHSAAAQKTFDDPSLAPERQALSLRLRELRRRTCEPGAPAPEDWRELSVAGLLREANATGQKEVLMALACSPGLSRFRHEVLEAIPALSPPAITPALQWLSGLGEGRTALAALLAWSRGTTPPTRDLTAEILTAGTAIVQGQTQDAIALIRALCPPAEASAFWKKEFVLRSGRLLAAAGSQARVNEICPGSDQNL